MLHQPEDVSAQLGNRNVALKTGKIAKQANGSIILECGKTVLLATAVMSKQPKEGADFFPLMIEFNEKMYASGKIPGGFFKREARPSTDATLIARLIDRPLRPSFPDGMRHDIQVVVTVLSYDPEFPLDAYAINACSAALSVSNIPFNGPVGAVLVGQVDGQFIANPGFDELERSSINIVIAGTKDAVLMVEASANEVSEETVLDAIAFGHDHIRQAIALQDNLVQKAGKEKVTLTFPEDDATLISEITGFLGTQITEQMQSGKKAEIDDFLTGLGEQVKEKFATDENGTEVTRIFNKIKKAQIRKAIISKKIRPDGRRLDEIRPIEAEVGLLPQGHGSALFTRGETQSLGVVTLGSGDDAQTIDGLNDSWSKSYYFHYNFPPYSVGETGRFTTGRRELGHGALAERALKAVIPGKDTFPYTIRVVSEIFESNGSSSMASVCSGSLSLMDCGVPIKAPVSGIAMGLLISDEGYVILSDIQGLEDHYGDMDFKVAGTTQGITALQLDIKVAGLTQDILKAALAQAKTGRLEIMDTMTAVLDRPRSAVADNAPKLETLKVNPEKVGALIGPGGKMIRHIEEQSGANVTVSDGSTGEVSIAAPNAESMSRAIDMINLITKDPEPGETYEGKVTRITNFGCFVEILPGKEGLVHISKLSKQRVNRVEDVVEQGQMLKVRVREIDSQNRLNLEVANMT